MVMDIPLDFVAEVIFFLFLVFAILKAKSITLSTPFF